MASAGQAIRRSLLSSPELHVLAVDDSLVDRKVIEKLLKSFSCKVTAVDSGRRALQYLGLEGDNNYDDGLKKVNLIMTDYSMPGMTGYDLLKKIKGSSACKDIPVVIMSSETILARIDRCLEEGAQDFLEKPVKLSDIQRLTTILATHHTYDEDDDDSSDQGTTNKRKKLAHTDDDVDDDDSSYQAAAKRLKRIYK